MTSIESIKSLFKSGSQAALIMSEENVRYFTSFTSSNGYLLITKNISAFLTDSRYIEAAKNTITVCDEVCEIKSVRETLVPLINNLGIKSIYIEQSRMTLSRLYAFKKLLKDVEFVTDSSLDAKINELRSVKNKQEAEKIEKAQRIAEAAFDRILKFIAVGKTEREISLELDYTMLRSGADALSFETIVVSGANGSMPHGVPGSKKIEKGDFITMDFGAVFDGYHSDMTRTVAVGEVSQKQIEVYNTVLKAQKAGLEVIKPKIACKTVDETARNVIKSKGYGEYFGHSFGHGVGIEIHEFPNLSPKSESVLKIGNVVTAEPGIYIPGEFGVRIEDMVIVSEDGCYNFTKCEKELIVLQ